MLCLLWPASHQLGYKLMGCVFTIKSWLLFLHTPFYLLSLEKKSIHFNIPYWKGMFTLHFVSQTFCSTFWVKMSLNLSKNGVFCSLCSRSFFPLPYHAPVSLFSYSTSLSLPRGPLSLPPFSSEEIDWVIWPGANGARSLSLSLRGRRGAGASDMTTYSNNNNIHNTLPPPTGRQGWIEGWGMEGWRDERRRIERQCWYLDTQRFKCSMNTNMAKRCWCWCVPWSPDV